MIHLPSPCISTRRSGKSIDIPDHDEAVLKPNMQKESEGLTSEPRNRKSLEGRVTRNLDTEDGRKRMKAPNNERKGTSRI